MKTMGIDASLTSTGIVVMEEEKVCYSAAIKTKPVDYKSEISRLIEIRNRVAEVILCECPQKVYIEGFSFGSQGKAVYQIGELGGLLRELLQNGENATGLEWKEIPPSTLKKFITGKGNAKKEDMKLWCYKRWNVEFKTNDECDAYALAMMAQKQAEPLKDLALPS